MTYQKRYEKIVRLHAETGNPRMYFGKLADLCQEVIVELEKSDEVIVELEKSDKAMRRRPHE